MTKRRLFWLSFLFTTVGMSAVIYVDRPPTAPHLVRLSDNVFLTSQLSPENLRLVRRQAVSSIIDLRPDGEEVGQPSSEQIQLAAQKMGLDFHYIPVPHERIPDSAVEALKKALQPAPVRTVLYCRTGRRAARTFALAEASRAGGPTSDDIIEMVNTAGFSAEDLRPDIVERIAHRNSPPQDQKP